MANRHWQLARLELTGPAASWRAQLDKHLAAGNPCTRCCPGSRAATGRRYTSSASRAPSPCLFPNVEVPVIAERDFYPMYFSKGVLLEAQLIARTILGADNHPAAGAVEQV